MEHRPATLFPRTSAWLWLASAVCAAGGLCPRPGAGTGAACEGADQFTEDDPGQDGWTTEVLQSVVGEQWSRLADLLCSSDPLSPRQLDPLIADGFRCGALRPEKLEAAFRDPSVTVLRRPAGEEEAQGSALKDGRGADGFAAALDGLRRSVSSDARCKFKIFRIQVDERSIVTRQFVTLCGHDRELYREIHATWRARWSRPRSGKESPRLMEIHVVDYEEAVSREGPLFADCTEAVLGHNPCYRQQLVYSMDYWSGRMLRVDASGIQGCAVGDVNGDGLDDLYLCQSSWLPNRLFIHTADGRAVDRSREAGVDWHEKSAGALLIDLDNDGDQDLAIGTSVALLILENDGTGRFTPRHKAIAARGALTITAADYDLDGDLDIYACVYAARALRREILAAPVPFHDARNGGPNVLLRNDGEWRFEDATLESGLEEEASRRSFAASWEDYDNDGDADLYVANDYGPNNLFRNDGGRFTDVAALAGVRDQSFGMSASWSDFNRDGWMDLYVANMFSSAGNRVTYQERFRPDEPEEIRRGFQYMARGNSLFQNHPDGAFRDVSQSSGAMVGLWAWGSQPLDVNNDGYEDILVPNGYYTRSDPHDL